MDDFDEFAARNADYIAKTAEDTAFQADTWKWMKRAFELEYPYHFRWMGVPIIQFPQDILAIQELIWETRPEVIIETGVARGGSVIFYSSMLSMIDSDGIVVGVDIDIREHNRKVIESHPMASRIHLVSGSSVAATTVDQVKALCPPGKRALVVLDSMHSHAHVLEELKLYSQFVGAGSYLVVLDTAVEKLPKGFFKDRPWDVGNSPYTAVTEFLSDNSRFEIDTGIDGKLAITAAPGGYLRCVADPEA